MNFWILRRKVHSSWLVAITCLGIVIGTISAPALPAGIFSSSGWIVLAAILAIIGFWRRRRYVVPIVCVAGVLIGLCRSDVALQQLAPYENLIGRQMTITGKVSEDVDIGSDDELIMRLHVMQVDGHSMTGVVWVSTSKYGEVRRGDIVHVRGKLTEGFGSFAGSMYRASVVNVQRPQPGDVALRVRDGFADEVRTAIPEPQASLGLGYLVGQRRALPPDLSESLQIAGLTHVIVASGYNLTILVRIARRAFVKISKYLAALSAGSMILGFIAVSGISPSMSRAGLVAGLGLLAWYYGRKFHPFVLLPFAAAVTLLVNPSYGWNDLGWQLSFAAFAGVMVVAPLMQRYLFGDEKPKLLRQILGETIAAQLATLPILVLAFGQFSNVAILANLLVLPLVPLAMLLTFVAGFGAIMLPVAATVVGAPATLLLQYMTSVATNLARVPWAQTTLEINTLVVVGYYAVLAGLCIYMWRKTGYSLRDSNLIE